MSTSSIVITPNNPQYSTDGPWSAWAGAWGAGSLVYGVDYTQSITLDGSTFPNGTLISWSFPLTGGPFGVWSYPCIIYGSTPELINPTVPSTQVANFANLSTSYSAALTVNSGQLDTIFDIWLTSRPYGGSLAYEIEIAPQTDWTVSASALAYTLTDSTLQSAGVYVRPDWGTNTNGVPWTNIAIVPSSEMLAGTISISDILKSLIWNGVITGKEYISGVEFGPEPGSGRGNLLINSLSYQWNGTPTIELTAGNDTFEIATPGGNDVVGNGGVDTVVYNGIYSEFQIKSSGSETLVTENNNISTLDYLEGVTYIQFSDGTYDTVVSTFTPAGQAVAPTVTSVTASGTGITNGNGDLTVGSVVTLTLNMSEAVTVTGGSPTLTLGDGGTATYTGGSGSTTSLSFSYTVAAGQNTPDLTVTSVNANGATITDSAGNNAPFSGTLTPAGMLQIDTTPPAAPAIANDTINGNKSVSLTGTAEANSTVTVYDGSTALGTTTASASGAWSYTTGTLANGTQVFTATATDAAGNTSAASNAIDPTIGLLTGVQARTLSVANGRVLEITGTVDNTGTIALHATAGVADLAVVTGATLTGSGKVTLSNNAGNVIGSNGAPATLTNVKNTIAGAGTIGDGDLTLVNQGVISANQTKALVINTGSNTITNSGTLKATASGGLDIESNVSNSKTIGAYGTNAKVVIESNITNAKTGLILASGTNVQIDLDNATISGGTLQRSGGNAYIETVSGSTDAIDGVSISRNTSIEINGGSRLTLNGAVANSGTLLVNGGTLDVVGALTGGTTKINGAGTVVMTQSSSESVVFLSKSTGKLILDQATGYTGKISGLGTTQSIDLTDINFATAKISYAANNRSNSSGVLTVTDGTSTAHLQVAGTYTLASFKVASDGDGGTLLTDPTVVKQNPGNASAIIRNDSVLEINTPDAGKVTFTGTSGALWLDQPSTFTGKVSGLEAQNVIDFSRIAFDAQTTLGYSPNSNDTGGALSLTDGTICAKIALLGSYMASGFVTESDHHGGTMVLAEATQSVNQPLLANPQHA